MALSLPPVIERLKRKTPPSELEAWVRQNVYSRPQAKSNRDVSAAFDELFARIASQLQDSSVHVALTPDNDPFWKRAPKSQAFVPVLRHYLEAELQQRPDDERVLWSLGGLAVRGCANDFGREYWLALCARDLRNVRWLVESAMWVLYNSGCDTTKDLTESLEELSRTVPGFPQVLQRFTEDPDRGLERAGRVALSVMRGEGFVRWLPEYR